VLAWSLFIFGYTEKQALLARIKGKGLVVFTGCGHPTIKVILEMVKRLSDEPLYAIGGGLHFPVTEGRGNRAGWYQVSDNYRHRKATMAKDYRWRLESNYQRY